MKKQILLYQAIYPDTAAGFIEKLEASTDGALVRVNCPGGDPYSTYGMIAMVNAMTGIDYCIDGQANSCAAYAVIGNMKAATSECLDVSTMVVHRAASWMESYPAYYTDQVKAELKAVNDNLRKILEDNIDDADFKKVTGKTYDQVFDMNGRLDVRLNAKQMKKLGIVTKVTPLTTARKKEIVAFAGQYGIAAFAENVDTNIESNINTDIMEKEIKTLAELKAAYPALVLEAETAAITGAMTSEKERIAAWQQFAKIDAEAVTKGIEGGKAPSMIDISSFAAKALSPEVLEKMRKDNINAQTTTVDSTKSAKDLEVEAFLNKVNNVKPVAEATAPAAAAVK